MQNYMLEVCVDSVESAVNAMNGGADRLELCSNLIIGGTTPTAALFRSVKQHAPVRTNVLIRPRFGDFLYTEYEFEIIKQEVEQFRELGADGVVIGCLKADGELDVERLAELKQAAGPMNVTLHRAFDVCRDPFKALEQVRHLGIDTILTSGQQNSCSQGAQLIKELVDRAGEVQILVGSGVKSSIIPQMADMTGASSFHLSGKMVLDSGMEFRLEGVDMGIDGIGEFQIFRTSEDEIRAAKAALMQVKERR